MSLTTIYTETNGDNLIYNFAIEPNSGEIYIAYASQGSVYRVDTSGTVTSFAEEFDNIQNIVFDNIGFPDGFLYLMDASNTIYKIGVNGHSSTSFITNLFNHGNHMTFHNNSLYYTSDNTIYQIDENGDTTEFISPPQTGAATVAIAFDTFGNAYTAYIDSSFNTIYQYDSAGVFQTSEYLAFSTNYYVKNLVIDSQNNFYIVFMEFSESRNLLIKYDYQGTELLTVFIDPTVSMWTLQVDSNDNVYFNNAAASRITLYSPNPAPTPISNICFPAGTPVATDQGIVAIQCIDPAIHTIENTPVLHITQTIDISNNSNNTTFSANTNTKTKTNTKTNTNTNTNTNFLVCFSANSLGKGVPTQDTIVSKKHKVLYQGELIEARYFLNTSRPVRKVRYNGEILYNVLTNKYQTMNINGMTFETLHPNNPIAKLYNTRLGEHYRNEMIKLLNTSIKNNDYAMYQRLIKRLC